MTAEDSVCPKVHLRRGPCREQRGEEKTHDVWEIGDDLLWSLPGPVCNYRALDSPGISVGLDCSPEDANLESPLELPVALSVQCIFPQLEYEMPGMFDKNACAQVFTQPQESNSPRQGPENRSVRAMVKPRARYPCSLPH